MRKIILLCLLAIFGASAQAQIVSGQVVLAQGGLVAPWYSDGAYMAYAPYVSGTNPAVATFWSVGPTAGGVVPPAFAWYEVNPGSVPIGPVMVLNNDTLSVANVDGNATTSNTCIQCGMHKQVFTASGTFTIPSGATSYTSFKWTIIGAGGAGGGGASGVSGAGGGAGATARVLATGYTAGNTITVTVGTGGAGTAGATGGSGLASSIASGTQTITTVTAAGGGGGGGGNSPSANPGGVGGCATNGDADSTCGGDGGAGTSNSASQGATGGASSMGGGGAGGIGGGTTNGNNAQAWGSGGGGGSSNPAAAGGNGANGIVIVEWFQ